MKAICEMPSSDCCSGCRWQRFAYRELMHYTTAGNAGGAYRTKHVDIEVTADAGGGYNVGWMAAGEWFK